MQIKESWKSVGATLQPISEGKISDEAYEKTAKESLLKNGWFTRDQVDQAIKGIVKLLEPETFDNWLSNYSIPVKNPKKIGLIVAGNIPMAGFHDILCVNLAGHESLVKLSSDDQFLIPYIIDLLAKVNPEAAARIQFTKQLSGFDATIATGSNNTSRYFEYYFGKQPHIFRKNRNSVAVITGKENEFDFMLLGRDIFSYYGLGCRNVSKLYVPENYVFDELFQNLAPFGETLMQHSKYMNNYDYHRALFLLNRTTFLTNNFLIITENEQLSSPVSVLNFEYYKDENDLKNKLNLVQNQIQCVVSKNSLEGFTALGQAQFPAVNDYADKVDTMAFLSAL